MGKSGNSIILDITSLAADTGYVNIVYGDKSFGGGAFVDGSGITEIIMEVSETSHVTFPLASQPQVNIIAATMTPTMTQTVFVGEGSITVSPVNLTDGSFGNTVTFVYTAGTSNWTTGTLRISLPPGWSQPNHSSALNPGFYDVTTTAADWYWAGAGNDILISVTGLQANTGTITIKYGDRTYGPGAYVTGAGLIKLTTYTDISSTDVHEIAVSPYVNMSPPTATVTLTPSVTDTYTFTQTVTLTETVTDTWTESQTPTITQTWTASPTFTATPSITDTFTFTATPTITVTFTVTLTPTPFWDILGGKSFSDGTADFVSLSIYNGQPYVAYEDNMHSNGVTVMKYSSGAWSPVGAKGFTGGISNDCSLGVVTNPYLAYRDFNNGNKATVMKYDGSAWSKVGGAAISPGAAYEASLYTDGFKIFTAYRDNSNGGRASCRLWFGSVWSDVGSPGFSSGTASSISLDVDSAGTPYVAFKEWGFDNLVQKLSVMKKGAADIKWVYVGGQYISSAEAEHISFKIGGSPAVPYVAYADYANGKKLTVKRFNGTTWDVVGTAGVSAGEATSISLFFNAAGEPSVAMADVGLAGKACVYKFNGATWDLFAILSDGAAGYVSAGYGNGKPFVAFKDIVNGNGVTVMTYEGAF